MTTDKTTERYTLDNVKWSSDVVVDTEAYNELTWAELEVLNGAILRTQNVQAGAKLLTKIISKLPATWGDPKSADTYLNMPRRVMRPFFEHIVGEINGKN